MINEKEIRDNRAERRDRSAASHLLRALFFGDNRMHDAARHHTYYILFKPQYLPV